MTNAFVIDLAETFPHLPKAPVTEAVLEIKSSGVPPWDRETAAKLLREVYPDFSKLQNRWLFEANLKIGDAEESNAAVTPKNIWRGVQVRTDDEKEVINAEAGLFSYSRMSPYPGWEDFTSEGLRHWSAYSKAFTPSEVTRLGMRFVNTLIIPKDAIQIEHYLTAPPKEPIGLELPYQSFLLRDTFVVPGYDYVLQVSRAIAPKAASKGQIGLVIDIDVGTTGKFAPAIEIIEQKLAEMRWLKNRAFFGSLTPEAISLLQ